MPFLDICDGKGKLDTFAGSRLLVTMLYPAEIDDEKRELFFERMVVSGLNSVEFEGSTVSEEDRRNLDQIELIALRNLDRAEITSTTLFEDGARCGAKGFLAGMVLQFLLRTAVHAPEHSSLNKAFYVVNGLSNLKENSRGKGKIGVAVSKLKEYWKDHLSDCHLHAAAVALILDGHPDWYMEENIPAFLFISEIYRALGESMGYLNPSHSWRKPTNLRFSDFGIPDLPSSETISILFSALSADEMTILKTYRADH
jgi:hypothetical protein